MDVREKLIELLDRFVYDEWYSNDDIADKLISNGVTVQEWISVDDRLPEDGARVLVTHDDGVVRIGICRGGFPAVMSKKHEKAFGLAEVTHWMPLPQPPKGE